MYRVYSFPFLHASVNNTSRCTLVHIIRNFIIFENKAPWEFYYEEQRAFFHFNLEILSLYLFFILQTIICSISSRIVNLVLFYFSLLSFFPSFFGKNREVTIGICEFNNLSRGENFLNNSIGQFTIPVANTNDSFYFLRSCSIEIGWLFCCSSRYLPRAWFCVKNWSKLNSKYRMYLSRAKTRAHMWQNIWRIGARPHRISVVYHVTQGDLSRLARCCVHVTRDAFMVHCCIERAAVAYCDRSQYTFLVLLTVFTNGWLSK